MGEPKTYQDRSVGEVKLTRAMERKLSRRAEFVPENLLKGLESKGYEVGVKHRERYDVISVKNGYRDYDFYFDDYKQDPAREDYIKEQHNDMLKTIKGLLK